ncbi:MAG: hypothetical protein HY280_05640 [Nitrospinae bacterium]|nr:hypothetical protein [Nitrospinota bacterium]
MFGKMRCDDKKKCGEAGVFCGCRCAFGIAIALLFVFVFGYFVQLLWNWIVPSVFATVGKLAYLQAVGLVVLTRLLFGHCGRHGSHGRWGYKKHGHHHHDDDCCGGEKEDESCCSAQDWNHYDEWWKKEGEESFKKYVEGVKGSESNPPA